MTVALSGQDIAGKLADKFRESIIASDANCLVVKSEPLPEIAAYLKNEPEFNLHYLNYVTAVDYFDHFEIVYQLSSLDLNHSLVIKTRCYERENPTVPSVVNLWQGADFQEREIYDLMGIRFEGHPNMKRIFLWEGFAGHPLRKDYL